MPDAMAQLIKWPNIGSGLFLKDGGSVCLAPFAVECLFGNHASTGDDDVFGDFTICD